VELNHFAQSFCGLVSHFATMLCYFLIATMLSHSSLMQCSVIFQLQHCSVILLFCYSEFNHFVILSAIFASLNLAIFAIVLSHFFNCYSAQPFLIDTILSHFLIATVLIIPLWYIAQSLLVLLQCSVVPIATVLIHSSGYSTQAMRDRAMWFRAALSYLVGCTWEGASGSVG
jgi:hypothetical protein